MNTQSNRPVLPQVMRWAPAFVGVGALLVLVLALVYPPAQAAAQGFLDLFRVKNFTAITVDPARMQQIANSKIDFESLVGKNVEVVKKAGDPQTAANAAAAAQAAGFTVKTPARLPTDATLASIMVQGESIVRVTADTGALQSLLTTLNLSDVKVPAQLNGAVVTIHRPTMVVMRYTTGRDPITLMQAKSPEVQLPAGVSMASLGEIGLRILGLSAAEANQYSKSIDWNSTVLIPVPANAASFREVSVRNAKGLLITTSNNGPVPGPDKGARPHTLVLWSEGDMMYALDGGPVGGAGADLIDLANSLQ